MEPNGGDSAELCIERLTRKLSEVEAVVTASEGKANHMRKERDAAKTENEKLRKEVARLKNELLKVRMNSALKEKEITDVLDVKDGSKGTGYIDSDHLVDQKRRGSLPVSTMWRQTGARRGIFDHPKDLRKLLDKKSNELVQHRQQYRIFENKFQDEVNRCSKLEQDTECLKQLLVDLLGIHGRYHRSYVFPCSNFSAVVFLVLIFFDAYCHIRICDEQLSFLNELKNSAYKVFYRRE